jgi:hypothetical protein
VQAWAAVGRAAVAAVLAGPVAIYLSGASWSPVSQRFVAVGEDGLCWEERGAERGSQRGAGAAVSVGRVLNMVRACLPAVGAACGFWAVFFVKLGERVDGLKACSNDTDWIWQHWSDGRGV